MKYAFLFPLAAALALPLAGCGESAQAPNPAGEPAVSAGRLILPAVSGNPGAAYFTLKNDSAEPASLAGASIQGSAKAELHETEGGSMRHLTNITLGPGATAAFEPGGKHVMVFGLSKSLKAGDTTQLTLFFSGGKTVTGPLAVEAPGGADHGDAH